MIPLVELTGGEPLLQPGIHPAAEKLLAGYTVMMETRASATSENFRAKW